MYIDEKEEKILHPCSIGTKTSILTSNCLINEISLLLLKCHSFHQIIMVMGGRLKRNQQGHINLRLPMTFKYTTTSFEPFAATCVLSAFMFSDIYCSWRAQPRFLFSKEAYVYMLSTS